VPLQKQLLLPGPVALGKLVLVPAGLFPSLVPLWAFMEMKENKIFNVKQFCGQTEDNHKHGPYFG
jgi:hypothetical protein